MGLMDWLTSDIMGSGQPGGGTPMQPMPPSMMGLMDPMGNPTGQMDAAPTPAPGMTPPMPPMPMGMDAPSLADPMTQPMPGGQGGPMAAPNPATDAMPGGQGGPAPAPPMPMPRPAGAPGPLPPGTPPPMPGSPTPLTPTDASAAMKSYTDAGGGRDVSHTLSPGSGGPQAKGMIARALGISPDVENRMSRGLAAGLKAAGNSSGKSPFQALTSGAGATLEGENTSDDNEYNKKIKYLSAAVADKAAGNKESYNNNYLKYLGAKLKSDTDKAAAWNKPDSQKFLDVQRAVSQDPEISASQKMMEKLATTGSDTDIAKAQAAHTALVKQKEGQFLSAVGLDAKKLAFNAATPPGTPPSKGPDGKANPGNPHVVTSQADFDTYVKPGQAYTNPADGKVYIRKGGEGDSVKVNGQSVGVKPISPAEFNGPTPPLPPGLPPMMPGMMPASSDEE